MVSKKKMVLVIGMSMVAMSANATVCETDLLTNKGKIIETFQGVGFDKKEACKESRKACSIDKRQRQRQGRNLKAYCQLVGVVNDTDVYEPTPGTDPTPSPTPFPDTGDMYGYELDNIESILESSGWRARMYAAQELTKYPTLRALLIAIDTLGDSDIDVRNAATQAVKTLSTDMDVMSNSEEVIYKVSPLLDDSSWKVREIAAKVLSQTGDAQAIISLIKASGDSDIDVRNTASAGVRSLMGSPNLKQVVKRNKSEFEDLIQSTSWKTRVAVLDVLAAAMVPKTITMVVIAAGDGDIDVRNAADEAMVSITNGRNFTNVGMKVINQLIDLYSSTKWKVRMNTIKTLGKTYSPAAKVTIINALDDRDIDVRRAAEEALRSL